MSLAGGMQDEEASGGVCKNGAFGRGPLDIKNWDLNSKDQKPF